MHVADKRSPVGRLRQSSNSAITRSGATRPATRPGGSPPGSRQGFAPRPERGGCTAVIVRSSTGLSSKPSRPSSSASAMFRPPRRLPSSLRRTDGARVRLLGRNRHQVCRHTDSVQRLKARGGPRCGGKEVVLTSERSHLARGGELRLQTRRGGFAAARRSASSSRLLLAGAAIRPEGAGRVAASQTGRARTQPPQTTIQKMRTRKSGTTPFHRQERARCPSPSTHSRGGPSVAAERVGGGPVGSERRPGICSAQRPTNGWLVALPLAARLRPDDARRGGRAASSPTRPGQAGSQLADRSRPALVGHLLGSARHRQDYSLSRLIASTTDKVFAELSAVTASAVKDAREEIAAARHRLGERGAGTILFSR